MINIPDNNRVYDEKLDIMLKDALLVIKSETPNEFNINNENYLNDNTLKQTKSTLQETKKIINDYYYWDDKNT